MSFSNPVAKSVGADGTAPGRVWESRLLPALITSNIVVVGVLCVPVGHAGAPHPPLFVCFAARVRGLCGVVDIADELLCFVDQGVAEESGTRQQHQPPVRDRSRV